METDLFPAGLAGKPKSHGDLPRDAQRVANRQAGTGDLGAMAKRTGAKFLILTHLAPAVGAVRHGPYKVPDGPLTEEHYAKVVRAAGFVGNVVVGRDLATVRLPAK